MYARRKGWNLEDVSVHLSFDRSYKEDCMSCHEEDLKLGKYDMTIEIEGDLDDAQKARLLEIAHKCPVHKTLAATPEYNIVMA